MMIICNTHQLQALTNSGSTGVHKRDHILKRPVWSLVC